MKIFMNIVAGVTVVAITIAVRTWGSPLLALGLVGALGALILVAAIVSMNDEPIPTRIGYGLLSAVVVMLMVIGWVWPSGGDLSRP